MLKVGRWKKAGQFLGVIAVVNRIKWEGDPRELWVREGAAWGCRAPWMLSYSVWKVYSEGNKKLQKEFQQIRSEGSGRCGDWIGGESRKRNKEWSHCGKCHKMINLTLNHWLLELETERRDKGIKVVELTIFGKQHVKEPERKGGLSDNFQVSVSFLWFTGFVKRAFVCHLTKSAA